VQETVWLGDIPIATLRSNGSGGVNLFYVHTDHPNTPRLVTDTPNNIRWRWDSDPFGSTAPNENPSSLGTFEYNLRFPGQQYDQIVGLHYNYSRDLDPAVGRYIESDPIGLKGGINTYSYVLGNPVTLSDPLGLATTLTVRCGPVMSGGVHCEVIAKCKGNSKSFQIGGPDVSDWQKLVGGHIPPKKPVPNPPEDPPLPGQRDYSATCSGDECECKTFSCLEKAFANAKPPPYYALSTNSNTFAHWLLTQCGCALDPWGGVFSQKEGYGTKFTSPAGAFGW
jgi:RHS repeat-associated protein